MPKHWRTLKDTAVSEAKGDARLTYWRQISAACPIKWWVRQSAWHFEHARRRKRTGWDDGRVLMGRTPGWGRWCWSTRKSINPSTHQSFTWFGLVEKMRCCFKLLLLEPTAPVLLVCLCGCGYLFVHSFLAMYLNTDSSLVQSCWLVCSMLALLHGRPVLPAESLCGISFCPIHLKRFFERLG